MSADDEALDRILAERIYAGDAYKPFAEMTLAEVEARAEELRGAAGFGPTQRVASVASVWKGLAEVMAREGAASVAELDRDSLRSRADRLWVVPPGGSFL
ncbi:MAG: hypothetical protein M3Q53_02800 [Actinomycetota bacterium]|nr:hypothetical protein [Actinomycetota bacterium]